MYSDFDEKSISVLTGKLKKVLAFFSHSISNKNKIHTLYKNF